MEKRKKQLEEIKDFRRGMFWDNNDHKEAYHRFKTILRCGLICKRVNIGKIVHDKHLMYSTILLSCTIFDEQFTT